MPSHMSSAQPLSGVPKSTYVRRRRRMGWLRSRGWSQRGIVLQSSTPARGSWSATWKNEGWWKSSGKVNEKASYFGVGVWNLKKYEAKYCLDFTLKSQVSRRNIKINQNQLDAGASLADFLLPFVASIVVGKGQTKAIALRHNMSIPEGTNK